MLLVKLLCAAVGEFSVEAYVGEIRQRRMPLASRYAGRQGEPPSASSRKRQAPYALKVCLNASRLLNRLQVPPQLGIVLWSLHIRIPCSVVYAWKAAICRQAVPGTQRARDEVGQCCRRAK